MDKAPTDSGITATQPQLFALALNPADVVYTPDWVARDMVEYFQPTGRILEPCAGDGVFLKYLPEGTEWCEIEKGRDFFAWREPVDWIVGNPPYQRFTPWIEHSFSLAPNILYLIPLNKVFNSAKFVYEWLGYGGIREMRLYAAGGALSFPIGFAIGAVHFQRRYKGSIKVTVF